ncbi:MAG TPA: LytTR family DNA-binding domain-containing protein [Kofleriaceae bacterium]|nr:LytTR family DNA-binding domain-containing protein [Kofleriaceae bacterium]
MHVKLRAYLVDDEPLALARLARLLQATGRVEVVGSTTEPEEAVEVLTRAPPDVCFLDIQMPRLNGFEVLARVPEQPIVVFTTAHDRYALDAFAVNSVDYLLKPVEAGDLERALAKVERLGMAAALSATALGSLVKAMAGSLRETRPEYPERIATRLGERLRFIDLATVTHFFAEDKLTYASVGGVAHCVDHSIAELEQRLDPRQFLRIHRATLVNLAHVKEVAPLPGGGLNLRLRGDAPTDLTVSRDRARLVKTRLGF